MSKRFGKTPCHNKEYTLEVVESNLADGTATLRIFRDGQPFQKHVVGVSFCILPPSPSTEIILDKCCKQYVTDCDGLFDITFLAGAMNNVRINVNIQLGACGGNCGIRLTKCLTPNTAMDVCPLEYLSMDEGVTCLVGCGK